MASLRSEEVFIEVTSKSNASSKSSNTVTQELELTTENYLLKRRKSEVYIDNSDQCKMEAEKQTSSLIILANNLCENKSPKTRRKGEAIKKLAPHIEKHVFNGIQEKICDAMCTTAMHMVFGTPKSTTASSNSKSK